MPPPILQLDHVSYLAGGGRIIDDVSWRVERGEHWAVLGPNGAGKTTLLKLACGYLWPNDGGVILRNGEPLSDLRELRRSIGWVTSTLAGQIPRHEPALDTVVSGRLAQTGLKPIGVEHPTGDDYARARDYLSSLGGDELVAKPFGVLSQGEQQKVLLARARMALPLLIILDEPCAGLDPGARETLLASLEDLATQPDTPSLVLVTHHLEEIMPAFDRLLAMSRAKIVASGDKQQIVNEQLIAELYDTRPARLENHGGRYWPIW